MNKEAKEILKYIEQFVFVDQSYNETRISKIDCKLLLDYITDLQKRLDFMIDRNDEKQDKIDKALEIYENRNSIKFKKQRFMEDKDTGDLMYDILKGEE